MKNIIYHIAFLHDWEQAQIHGNYLAQSLASEGFIHCSHQHQIEGVLQRYFTNQTNLILLTIDITKLESECKNEWANSVNEYFPHVYGAINISAVIATQKIDH